MKLTVRAFTSMRPGVSPDLLQPGEAVYAWNTILQGGDMDPLKSPLLVTALTDSASEVKTIYRYGQSVASDTQYWFQSNNVAHFVKGPIDGDTEERTYYTGHASYPTKVKSGAGATGSPPYPTSDVPMGLYKPSAAPTLTVTGTATDPESVAEDVAYVVTLVTNWNEEGPPSDASAVVSWRAGQAIDLVLPTAGGPSYPGNLTKSGQTYTGKRLYRSATGASGSARWLLVNTEGDIDIADSTYTDNKITANLGEALPTKGFLEPPDDMRNLTQMANGMMAGVSGSTVCFCEPFTPYAWPVAYQQSLDAPAQACAAFGQSLLVTTTRSMYLFTGPDPANITSEKLPEFQTCIAPRAMVPMLGGVVFPTPDGLGYVGPGGFKMLSDGLFTRKEWVSFSSSPENFHAYELDGRYILFFNAGAGAYTGALIFKFGDEPSLSLSTVYATAGFRDAGRDALFLCIPGTGNARNVHKWDAGTNLQMTWQSGIFRLPSPANLGAARIHAEGSVTFELYADGVLVAGPYTITNSFPFKLPAGYRSQRYHFKVVSSSLIRSVEIGDTVKAVISE